MVYLPKARGNTKGRKYEEDEESEAEKKEIESQTKTTSEEKKASKEGRRKDQRQGGQENQNLQAKDTEAGPLGNLTSTVRDNESVPNVRSLPLRNIGSTRDRRIPLETQRSRCMGEEESTESNV